MAVQYVAMDIAQNMRAEYDRYQYRSGSTAMVGALPLAADGAVTVWTWIVSRGAYLAATSWALNGWNRISAVLNVNGAENSPPAAGEIPNVDWSDPSKPPKGSDGREWEWRGKLPQGGQKGGYVNPSNPGQSVHPDLNHPSPVGPHWDFTDRGKTPSGWRLYPDGTVKPK
jgi:hypothetical protein